jgi:hypothetical protein
MAEKSDGIDRVVSDMIETLGGGADEGVKVRLVTGQPDAPPARRTAGYPPEYAEARATVAAALAAYDRDRELGHADDADMIIAALAAGGHLVPEDGGGGTFELLTLLRVTALRIKAGKRNWSDAEVLADCIVALTRPDGQDAAAAADARRP